MQWVYPSSSGGALRIPTILVGGNATRTLAGQLTCLQAAATMGCSGPTAPSEPPAGLRWGTLEHYGDGPLVTVPGEVAVGSISAKTYVGGCLAKGPTEVVVAERHVLVRLYDIQETAEACTLMLRTVDHSAEIVFDAPDKWSIDIQGMSLPGEGPITVRHYVTVE